MTIFTTVLNVVLLTSLHYFIHDSIYPIFNRPYGPYVSVILATVISVFKFLENFDICVPQILIHIIEDGV